jgi:hypothetical protein
MFLFVLLSFDPTLTHSRPQALCQYAADEGVALIESLVTEYLQQNSSKCIFPSLLSFCFFLFSLFSRRFPPLSVFVLTATEKKNNHSDLTDEELKLIKGQTPPLSLSSFPSFSPSSSSASYFLLRFRCFFLL